MPRPNPWIIVGAGASGLAVAFFLRQLGLDSVIVERNKVIGGRMGTVRLGNRRLDCGGKNIGRTYRLFRQFAASLGTHPLEYFGLNSSQVIDGTLKTFDGSARWRSLAAVARGASASDLARFGRLLWRVRSDEGAGYLGSPYARTLGQMYDSRPATAYFSASFCDRVVRPMTVRMNGAEPDEVHLGTLGSNVRMLLDTYDQFTHGLAPLLRAFTDRYDVRLDARTEGLIVDGGRVTGVQVRHGDGHTRELRGAGVILAIPANAAASLTAPFLPALAKQLRNVAYYPVTLVLAEYDTPVFSSDVRALVFGSDQELSNAGAYGINDLHVVRYTFSGRAFRRSPRRSDVGALLEHAEAALARHVPFDPGSRVRFVAREFTTGLCAYTPHHGRFVDRVAEELRRVDGLYITGDYVQGASIEACFRSAAACAHHLARREQVSLSARADSHINEYVQR